MFSSFSDAPDGFNEEIKEITFSSGLEYWYRDFFALRSGYFFENRDKVVEGLLLLVQVSNIIILA